MKKFLVALVIGFSVMTLSLDASAARLGGGSSFGRTMSAPKAPGGAIKAPAAPAASHANPARGAAGAAAASKGMGLGKSLLIGAASALGIMALANMLGLGEGFASMLMVLVLLGLAFVAFKFFMARRAGGTASTSHGASSRLSEKLTPFMNNHQEPQQAPVQKEAASQPASSYTSSGARAGSVMDQFAAEENGTAGAASSSSFEVPADFNKEQFLNMSTAYFKMLQKAWDSGDLDSLDNYCTPDMFRELTHKRREIKGANLTEVVTLKADLEGFETTPTEYVASVRFSGRLNENGVPVDIDEIWNLVKPREGKAGWMLAGIQQVDG